MCLYGFLEFDSVFQNCWCSPRPDPAPHLKVFVPVFIFSSVAKPTLRAFSKVPASRVQILITLFSKERCVRVCDFMLFELRLASLQIEKDVTLGSRSVVNGTVVHN